METATRANKQAILRDKRARGLVAMGLVKREGDRFRVQSPSLRGRRTAHEVWRDEMGKVRCSCLEYEEQSAQDPTFRCEHILAVKHALLAQHADKGAPLVDGGAPEASAARAPKEKQRRQRPTRTRPHPRSAPSASNGSDANKSARSRNTKRERSRP